MEDPIAVDVVVDENWNLRDIPPSGAIDIRSSLYDDLSAFQEKCRLYGLNLPTNAENVFQTALQCSNPIEEHRELPEVLPAVQLLRRSLNPRCLHPSSHYGSKVIDESCGTSLRGDSRWWHAGWEQLIRCSRPEPMLTKICFLPPFSIVLVHSCYWSLSYKSIKAWSALSQICEVILVIIQVFSILHIHLFNPTRDRRMRRVRNRSCLKLPGAFGTVLRYTTPTMIWNSGRIIPLYNRVCAIFCRVSITVW